MDKKQHAGPPAKQFVIEATLMAQVKKQDGTAGLGEVVSRSGPFESFKIALEVFKVVVAKANYLNGYIGEVDIEAMMREEAEAAAQRQVPPSEDVLKAMVAEGQVPGVRPDAEVKVESAPDNTVPFPGKPAE